MLKNLTLKKQHELLYEIGPYNKPRLTIRPNDTVIVETEDGFAGKLTDRRQKYSSIPAKYSNPQSGPIFVEGAEKGDTLVVDIRSITPRAKNGKTVLPIWWWYHSNPGTFTMNRMLRPRQPEKTRFCRIVDNKVHWNNEIVLPYSPMIGTIGTAPESQAISADTLGAHGGNMDLQDICPGTRLYLPVNAPGALLHLGDVHAVQGEGEICGSGMEMSSKVNITVSLIKGKSITWPRYETSDHIAAIATSCAGTTLEDAIRIAYVELALWLESEYGFDRWEAYHLLTYVGEVRLGNVWCAAAKFPKKYLPKVGTHSQS